MGLVGRRTEVRETNNRVKERTWGLESRQLSCNLGSPTNKLWVMASDFVFFSYKIQKLQLVMSMTFPRLTFGDSINRKTLKS